MNSKIHHTDEDHELSFEIEKYLQKSQQDEIDNSAMSAILSRTDRINFIGWPIKNINLLNWAKSLSVNPSISGLHAIYMDDSDSVLLHTALTGIGPFESFSTDSCMAYNPQPLLKTASLIGADKIFLLIQHPCGPLIPSSEERNLASSALENLGSLFHGIIIPGSRSYTLIDGKGESETKKISEGDSTIITALKRFRYILENHSLFLILLGVNKENRIVFWSFNKSEYPYELYHQVIEALGGTTEYIVTPHPSVWEKILVNQSLKDSSIHESPIRNPEILCSRLIQGAEVELIEHDRNEVTLLFQEEDLIPRYKHI